MPMTPPFTGSASCLKNSEHTSAESPQCHQPATTESPKYANAIRCQACRRQHVNVIHALCRMQKAQALCNWTWPTEAVRAHERLCKKVSNSRFGRRSSTYFRALVFDSKKHTYEHTSRSWASSSQSASSHARRSNT